LFLLADSGANADKFALFGQDQPIVIEIDRHV
jgi:hypothetical protein